MKINFVIPFTQQSGGIAVVLEHALRLRALGHDVAVYYPLMPYRALAPHADSPKLWKRLLLGRIRPFLRGLAAPGKRIDWNGPAFEVRPVPIIAESTLRDADVVVATAWPTAYSVAGLSRRKGRKFYFVQGFETWTLESEKAEASYRLPLELITISPWLTGLMSERFGRSVRAEIWNGVDLERFRPPPDKDWSKPRVLMMYSPLPLKGCSDGIEALQRLSGTFPAAEITLFGLFPPPPDFKGRFILDPSPERLVSLYGESSIFLYPSRGEGWGLPILEAMACQCAVVATDGGCVPVLKAEGNMMICLPRDVDAMHRNLALLLEDSDLCRRVALNGFATASGHGWNSATNRLAEALGS